MGFFSRLFGKKSYEETLKEEAEKNNSKPQIDYSKASFIFYVEDVFVITGRGTVVTGRCTLGSAKVGDKVLINGGIEAIITGVESFRKQINMINVGESAGILLKDVSREAVRKGDLLSK